MRAIVVLLFAFIVTRAAAQSSVIAVRANRSLLTAYGHVINGVGAGYERDVKGWIAVGLDVQAGRVQDRNRAALVLVDAHNWQDRFQAVADLHAVVTPLRFAIGNTRHSLRFVPGVVIRWKEETLLHGGLSGTVPDDATPEIRAGAQAYMEARRRLGSQYEVITFYYYGEGADAYPEDVQDLFLQPGTAIAYVIHNQATELGWSAGLGYTLEVGQLVLGASSVYRRYRNQRLVVGSHSLDLAITAGYRF